MTQVLRDHIVQAAVFVAVLIGLLALVVYLMRRWRNDAEQDQPQASDLLTKFRELHARGSLSDEEFRTIKTKLAAQMEQELSDRQSSS